MFRRPPHLVFHSVLGITGLVVLWAFSFPGGYLIALVPCLWIVAIAAATWLVRGVTYARARRQGTHERTALWFVIAPVGAIILALILYTNAPLRLRWQASKSEFRQAVVDVKDHPKRWMGRLPKRVGMYTITSVRLVDDGVIFYDSAGSFLDDAGFAYLPTGPSITMTNGTFENPQWKALGDHWYAWTASW